MSRESFVSVQDVMKRQFDLVDGTMTVKEALLNMKYPETRIFIINKRDDADEYGLVLISDIAKRVLAANRSPERVNLYEIMAKPVLSVSPEMNIKYCARLLERFSLLRAPVISEGKVLGVVSFHDLVLVGLKKLLEEES